MLKYVIVVICYQSKEYILQVAVERGICKPVGFKTRVKDF